MENSFGMRCGQTGTELARNVESFIFGKASNASQQRRQIFAVNILHGEEVVALDIAHVVHAANIGVRNASRDPHFVLESLKQSLIARSFVGKELESHLLAEREIIGPIDLTHAALSEQGNNAVTARQQTPGKKPAFAQIFRRTRGSGP